ncbi:MAG: hypothetical protein IKR18_03870, partial [Bacteroidaceae bacterium]|nr:hypothetical protein [Bacteroidaceae bacterium]
MKKTILSLALFVAAIGTSNAGKIDRHALVMRNNPVVESFDTLSSLSVGNGNFAYTVDASGLQTFPELYKRGVCLGTMSSWGWHSFDNPKNLRPEDAFQEFDFGHGHKEIYSTQSRTPGRHHDASEWYRINPHRLHLGCVGLEVPGAVPADFKNVRQEQNLWNGVITSRYTLRGSDYTVRTACAPDNDVIGLDIQSTKSRPAVNFRFAYPTGGHVDDACNWNADDRHSTLLVSQSQGKAVLKRVIDKTVYYVTVRWEGKAQMRQKSRNYFVLQSRTNTLKVSCTFSEATDAAALAANEVFASSAKGWEKFWTEGAAVDFSRCKDPRAKELERRVVLSQYLLAVNSAGQTPPQETGLTMNSWFGKFHLEMIWWHQAQFALWGHDRLLDRTLSWYEKAYPVARQIAQRQGFDGVRWMKMTDPSGIEAPSNVGSFLIWQQPHLIYLAEMLYRSNPSPAILKKYGRLVQATAEFMYSFASYDSINHRYELKGAIPAQETLKAAVTRNSPFELSYWHYAMGVAQRWRELQGQPRIAEWDSLIAGLPRLAFNADSLYLAAETATDTYQNIKMTSDHPALLGAVGVLPDNPLANDRIMSNTLNWIWDNWNWDETWGWDFPMVAMTAARIGEPQKAVDALLMDKRTNTYLVSGHNYQDKRLRLYLPGNGGLLTAVAMMCAGWDGSTNPNP